MRVTAIETIHVEAYPNITFVEVHTDEGLVGLGETFRTPKAIAAQIHETVAPISSGKIRAPSTHTAGLCSTLTWASPALAPKLVRRVQSILHFGTCGAKR